MSDENKKSAADAKSDVEEKSEPVKKPATVSKKVKVKAKSTDDSESDGNKKNIVKKLQAMGVMSGKESATKENGSFETKNHLKLTMAVVVAVAVVGSFVWALNKEASDNRIALDSHDHVVPSAYPGSLHAISSNPDNRNTRYPANNFAEQQKRIQLQREQQHQWMQKQRQAQEEQRAQQQKWNQQQQQIRAQQIVQQQKWAQQKPTQEQYRVQQQQWAEQHRQAQAQQRAQQQKWEEQQRQAQIQQRRVQPQPYYAYPPNAYNNRSPHQQAVPYYGR
ncbi:MAG: hypothetical protein QM484_10225 [Woeseiaceae bacterium]